MNRAVFSIIILALLAESCIAGIVGNSTGPQYLDHLYRAAVDIATTCYGDPGSAIGIVGDKDGSIVKALRSNRVIPVVLVDDSTNDDWDTARSHKLQVFIIAVNSVQNFVMLIRKLEKYIWWNYNGNFLIVDTRPSLMTQCSLMDRFMFATTRLGLLNSQVICLRGEESIVIWNSHPFMRRVPKFWSFVREYRIDRRRNTPPSFLFSRLYRKGGQSCDSINFAKTVNVAGFPLRFLTHVHPNVFIRETYMPQIAREKIEGTKKLLLITMINEQRWLIDTVVMGMNVSEVISKTRVDFLDPAVFLHPTGLTTQPELLRKHIDRVITRYDEWPIFAVTQHTFHKSQLDKILSVIDRESRIGVWLVYLITFLFFKFFLGQTAISALMDLVRLTSNMGLTTLPQNVAPTIYLTSLFMFVVTLQAIYTGNLATLLTTTIPYPNVQSIEDIPKLGYTLYILKDTVTKLTADPLLQGCVIELPAKTNCTSYILRDPLALCAMPYVDAIRDASQFKLHVSREPISHDYMCYISSLPNIFKSRIQEILTIMFEAGLSKPDPMIEKLRLQFVDDDEVKKNTYRRVMTFEDLRFAFVILGVGLLCSFVCFIGEIVLYRIRLKYSKRRNRVHVLPAWEATAERGSWFSKLNCRFNLRRLFTNRL